MTSQVSETPGLTLPPPPTPAWEVMESLQQAQANQNETQDGQTDDDDDDPGFDDHSDSDLDSALGSNLADSTHSLNSSIFEYRTLHGRTYHSDMGTAQYWASNDDQASESLDIAHHFTLLLLDDKLHLTPLGPNIQRVLDIGTGTAIWAIDFADEHPNVEVVGTEISPIEPSWIPPNLQLEIEDCNDAWTFRPDSFDFIHMRFMLGSITDWQVTFKEAFTACAPGGWVESYEVSSTMESDDDSIPDGSAMQRWGEVFEEGGQRGGRSFAIIKEDVQKSSMEAAGFVNINVEDLKAPVGGWHPEPRLRQVGQYMQAALERDYEGYMFFLACEVLGWTEDQEDSITCQIQQIIPDILNPANNDLIMKPYHEVPYGYPRAWKSRLLSNITTMATEEPAPTTQADKAPSTPQPLHPVTHWENLAATADVDGNDRDSVITSNTVESTASMTSSILSYRTIQGRTFHSERGNAHYWASNDEQQNESMDIVHHFLCLLLDDRLYLSPLKDGIQKALDIGTGTGIWAIDFADKFPGTKVIGTDISPIQPSWVPSNLEFQIDDCTLPWTFEPNSIDFVHIRYLYGSIKDWSALFKESFRACRPGGWVESHEASPMIESDDGTRKGMEDAGFVDIQVVDHKIPVTGWPQDPKLKEIGQYVQAALEQDFEGYILYMASQLLGWSMQEVTVYCAQLRRELRSSANHPFFRYRAVYGRKPEET
ncbi:hypothetical protein HG530_010875 [Fusarium avenaceum]|nr:hypothetical protein HG530_010875 [Fusarium avenaceum]